MKTKHWIINKKNISISFTFPSICPGYIVDNTYNLNGSNNSGTANNLQHQQQQANGDLFNYRHSGDAENLMNPSSNSVLEDHYHSRSTIQKSVGWATEDNLIQEERYVSQLHIRTYNYTSTALEVQRYKCQKSI